MAEAIRPTKKQRELLDYIEAFINEHGYSPSYREIMNGCQYNSVATVALHVGSLIKRGHLRKRDHSARSLEVVRQDEVEPQSSNGQHDRAWLVDEVRRYIEQCDPADQAQQNQVSVLLEALRILGMAEQADELESMQGIEGTSAFAQKAV